MIKEIVNLGKIVNPLASVFTMKVDDKRFIRIDIDKNFEEKIKKISKLSHIFSNTVKNGKYT